MADHFYRPLQGGIEIARVLHGRRDIDAIFGDEGCQGETQDEPPLLGFRSS